VGESRDSPVFEVPPIISGMGKATNVKFGRYIHGVHPNKSLLKFWEKIECGRIQGLCKFFEYPCYLRNVQSYELWTWRVYSQGPCEQKPFKMWENRERGRIQGLPNFLKYPLLSQEWVKLRTSNLAHIFWGSLLVCLMAAASVFLNWRLRNVQYDMIWYDMIWTKAN